VVWIARFVMRALRALFRGAEEEVERVAPARAA